MPKTPLPTNAAARKAVPIATGFVDYFPDAVAAVAALSKVGNDQHNPGKPLHWDRSKSGDESDALMRHFLDRGTFDGDGIRHSAKVAWRAMALLQKEIENENDADDTGNQCDVRDIPAADLQLEDHESFVGHYATAPYDATGKFEEGPSGARFGPLYPYKDTSGGDQPDDKVPHLRSEGRIDLDPGGDPLDWMWKWDGTDEA